VSRRGLTLLFPMALLAAELLGCGNSAGADVAISLRSPKDPMLLEGIDTFVFSVEDAAGRILALRRFDAGSGALRMDDVPFGKGLVFSLQGLYRDTPIITGRSCAVDVVRGQRFPSVSIFVARLGTFTATADPPSPAHTSALAIARADGTVLIAGGLADTGGAVAAVDGYDPRSGSWSSAQPLANPRGAAAWAELPNGAVLLAGGLDASGAAVTTADLVDPTESARTLLDDARLGLTDAAMVALPDGSAVLAGGGSPAGASVADAWVFDGATLHPVGPLGTARRAHTLSVVGSSTLALAFAAGGYAADGSPIDSIELYDPRAAAFSLESAHLGAARAEHTATVLATGEILLVGGRGAAGPLATAEIFDPITRTVSQPAGHLAEARARHSATLLADGRVLIAGGVSAAGTPLDSAEIYDPMLGDFAAARQLTAPRAGHLALALCDRTVLFVGGGTGAELYSAAR
jgi:hypothetical protein